MTTLRFIYISFVKSDNICSLPLSYISYHLKGVKFDNYVHLVLFNIYVLHYGPHWWFFDESLYVGFRGTYLVLFWDFLRVQYVPFGSFFFFFTLLFLLFVFCSLFFCQTLNYIIINIIKTYYISVFKFLSTSLT